MNIEEAKVDIAMSLAEIGALKFGEFTFKSGIVSPMYVDLRLFISYPKLLKKIAKVYAQQLETLKFDRLAGVAYAALPIAGAVSLEMDRPWIFMRKEALNKAYGLEKNLEGEYKKGETVVMIEDLVTKATSLLEAIPAIEKHGLVVKDAVVLLDYGKGGGENLKSNGYKLHAFMTMKEVVDIMKANGKIDAEKHGQCIEFIAG